jgi:hypothetical protein
MGNYMGVRVVKKSKEKTAATTNTNKNLVQAGISSSTLTAYNINISYSNKQNPVNFVDTSNQNSSLEYSSSNNNNNYNSNTPQSSKKVRKKVNKDHHHHLHSVEFKEEKKSKRMSIVLQPTAKQTSSVSFI